MSRFKLGTHYITVAKARGLKLLLFGYLLHTARVSYDLFSIALMLTILRYQDRNGTLSPTTLA